MSPAQVVWCLKAYIDTHPDSLGVYHNWDEIEELVKGCDMPPLEDFEEIEKYSNG